MPLPSAKPKDDVAIKSYPPKLLPMRSCPYAGAVEVPVTPLPMPSARASVKVPLIVAPAPFKSERFPPLSIVSAVVVANPAVEVEIANRFVVPPATPAMESFAKGLVVPMPTNPDR